MKKLGFLFILLLNCITILASSVGDKQMEAIGNEFRKCHPYGFQTVGLKHVGDDCVFIISEPSNRVTESSLQQLFTKYQGRTISQSSKLGYDGWMKDIIGTIHFQDTSSQEEFKKELFELLYGTAYKAEYTDLDNPKEHMYYSPYKLNYSISAAEISKWIIDDKELFVDDNGNISTIQNALDSNVGRAGKIFKSREEGFIAWILKPNDLIKNNRNFLINARKFALDSDLILGAFGNVGDNVAIIARKREVPVDILPPLRVETIELLCNTRNQSLAQSYERYHVFAGKTKENEDVAPIYLSDELWNTEYGNLLNVTDQMLKSWSENGRIEYRDFEYPKPIDWAFERGAVRDFKADELTYNWNTAGAGYVLQGNAGLDVFAVNRTGSLPVSYIPGGMEGKVDESVNDAEELAYDFFSGLNNPELVRVVQYATLYQIVKYFAKDDEYEEVIIPFRYDNPFETGEMLTRRNSFAFPNIDWLNKPTSIQSFLALQSEESPQIVSPLNNRIPNYKYFEDIVERLLHVAENSQSIQSQKIIEDGYNRFLIRYQNNSLSNKFKSLLEKDPYGEFEGFITQKYNKYLVDHLKISSYHKYNDAIKLVYEDYLYQNLKIIKEYIDNYKKKYHYFPYEEATHFLVCPRDINMPTKLKIDYKQKFIHLYSRIENYTKEKNRYKKDKINRTVPKIPYNISPEDLIEREYWGIKKEEKEVEEISRKVRQEENRIYSLAANDEVTKAMGTLNWLLTDSREYNEPFGSFFADQFKNTGSAWLKSPTIVCSSNGSGYGGHNLDSHITPIKFADRIPAGKCRVSKVEGKPVISVDKENWNRITPELLRSIERKNLSGLITLPKAPTIRPKSIISSLPDGPRLDNNGTIIVPFAAKKKGITINENHCNTVDELYENVNKSNGSVNEIHIREYSEREVLVSINNGPECILERSSKENFSLSNFDERGIGTEELANGNVVVKIPQRKETININNCTEASFGIEIPQKYSEVIKDAIIRIFNTSKEKINNIFKFKRAIKVEIGDDLPGIDPAIIQTEIMNTNQVRIIIEKDEVIYMVAA